MMRAEDKRRLRIVGLIIVAMGIGAVGVVLRWSIRTAPEKHKVVRLHVRGVMGTDATLTAVVLDADAARAERALRAARAALFAVEAKMSRRIERSDVRRLNAAGIDIRWAKDRLGVAFFLASVIGLCTGRLGRGKMFDDRVIDSVRFLHTAQDTAAAQGDDPRHARLVIRFADEVESGPRGELAET